MAIAGYPIGAVVVEGLELVREFGFRLEAVLLQPAQPVSLFVDLRDIGKEIGLAEIDRIIPIWGFRLALAWIEEKETASAFDTAIAWKTSSRPG